MWSVRHVTTFIALVYLQVLHGRAKPTVDPGLFMILGVETCRGGDGYCLLGIDCTLDDDFLPDDSNGHCDGLKNAFTPTAHFTCCKYNTDRDRISSSKRPRPGLKPTTSTTSTSTTTSSTSTTEAQTTLVDVTTTDSSNEQGLTTNKSDVFVDVNNEVFKEVTPPMLSVELPANVRLCSSKDDCSSS